MPGKDPLLGLQWTGRTYLRIFLVAAGISFAIRGMQTNESLELLLGFVALAVGIIGLIIERSEGD